MSLRRLIAPALAVLLLAAGCAGLPSTSSGGGNASVTAAATGAAASGADKAATAAAGFPPARRPRSSLTEPRRLLVVEGALSLVGKDAILVNGKSFPNDCTGVVRAAYWYAGIDLAKDFHKYSGNGVTRIYKTLEAARLLYLTDSPLPGDIIFWDNTYDRNEDGEWNDPLTHTGIVVAVSGDGQIEYVHANYRKGVIIEYMNLKNPDTVTKTVFGKTVSINSAMRMQGQVVNELWLSSHLLRDFGIGYLLK